MKLVKWFVRFYYHIRGYYPTRVLGKPFKGNAAHCGFWYHFEKNHWEPYTLDLLTNYLKPEHVYYDVGAWIGPTSIYASRLCRKVFSVEPDRVAYEQLLVNIRLNGLDNVLPFNIGLSAADGLKKVKSLGSGFGDTMTSLLAPEAEDSMTIPCMSWHSFVHLFDLEPPDFLKIDIEGGEFDLLPTMKEYIDEHRPILHLSLHAPFLPEAEREARIKEVDDILSGYSTIIGRDGETVTREAMRERAAKHFPCYLLLP